MNVRTGGFLCRAGCGQGGDVLDFVKLRYRLDFKGAKNYLRIDDSAVSAAVETVPVAWLLCDFSIDGVNYRAAVKDEPRDYAGRIRRFYRQARERLTELGLDKSETKAAEVCWTRMALALDELREMEIL